MVTIRDVARRLNLSITTVSRALDGYTDVSEQTRQRVRQAAAEMGYFPNHAARQLRRHQSDTIGFVLPAGAPRFNDPFFAEFLSGIGDAAGKANYDVLVSVAAPDSQEEKVLYRRWIQERKVDGWLITRTRWQDWRIRVLTEAGIPFVCLGKSIDGNLYPFIEIEAQESIAGLVTHLAEKGYRRIGYIGAADDLVLQRARYQGYLKGLEQCGLPYNSQWIEGGALTRQSGYLGMKRLLERGVPPDAVVCVNDLTALGAYRAVREAGRVIGRDIGISGFDGIEEAAQADPPLTTLAYSVYEVARAMTMVLLESIQNANLLPKEQIIIPELILRASTAD
ncbi:MAG: LacI family DNA-binding transcriptional regulator [Chloroflexota bacterium]